MNFILFISESDELIVLIQISAIFYFPDLRLGIHRNIRIKSIKLILNIKEQHLLNTVVVNSLSVNWCTLDSLQAFSDKMKMAPLVGPGGDVRGLDNTRVDRQ